MSQVLRDRLPTLPSKRSIPLQHTITSWRITREPRLPANRAHGIFHYVEIKSPPVVSRPRWLYVPPDKLRIAKKEFTNLVQLDICRSSNSPWAAPLHLVPKKQPGVWKPCGDYRGLNAVTTPDRYSLPHIHDLANILHGQHIFFILNLVKAYHQIPVPEEDVPKTAVIMPNLVYSNLSPCLSAYGMQHKPSNDSWIRSYKT